MNNLFSNEFQGSLASLSSKFTSARPFPHVIIEEFLNPQLCARLLNDFPAFEKRHALNEMGEVGGKAVRMDMPGIAPSYAELDTFLQTPEFLKAIEQLTGIQELLYDPNYIGGGTHENLQGQSLDAHVDFNLLPHNGWHRRLNLIIYLNPQWKSAWGGCLTLESDPWNAEHADKVEIVPTFNRCAIFETSEVSWHGFAAIELPVNEHETTRKSIAIYLYTRTRPTEQTAASHGTVYVPRGLPATLSSGSVLTESSFFELRRRFAQLRGQLKYLYQRELEFSSQLTRANLALSEARAASAIPLQGFVVLMPQTSGYFPDGWCEKAFSFKFRAVRAGKKLKVECWIPNAIARQTMQLKIGEYRQTLEVSGGRGRAFEVALPLKSGNAAEVEITCTNAWIPSSDGSSGDQRALAFKLVGAIFE